MTCYSLSSHSVVLFRKCKGFSTPANIVCEHVFVNSLHTTLVNICGLLAVCSHTIHEQICHASFLPLGMENTISLQTRYQCVVCHRQGKCSECGQMSTLYIIYTVHHITVFIITNKCMRWNTYIRYTKDPFICFDNKVTSLGGSSQRITR
jgi:hypothetical protein